MGPDYWSLLRGLYTGGAPLETNVRTGWLAGGGRREEEDKGGGRSKQARQTRIFLQSFLFWATMTSGHNTT